MNKANNLLWLQSIHCFLVSQDLYVKSSVGRLANLLKVLLISSDTLYSFALEIFLNTCDVSLISLGRNKTAVKSEVFTVVLMQPRPGVLRRVTV